MQIKPLKYISWIIMILFMSPMAFGQKGTGSPPGSGVKLSISHLDDFPDIIIADTAYYLSAWVVNTGAFNVGGEISVHISINGDPGTPIGEPFMLPNTLFPGDSVLWEGPADYYFDSYRFGGGGVTNDIIVWPTALGITKPDSISKNVIFISSLGFKVSNSLIAGLPQTVDFQTTYTADINAINLDKEPNTNPIDFYAQLDGSNPLLLKTINQNVEVGDTVGFSSNTFNLASLFEIQVDSSFVNAGPHVVFLWAFEKQKNRWVGYAKFGVTANVLPVELGAFSGQQDAHEIKLGWHTKSELNNDYFRLEKYDPASGFELLERVEGSGNSDLPTQYSAIDPYPAHGPNTYRLIQVDMDGTSRVVGHEVEIVFEPDQSASVIRVYPQPVSDEITFVLSNPREGLVSLELNGLSGKQLYQETRNMPGGVIRFETVLPDLAPGIYLYNINLAGQSFGGKLLKR